MQFRPRCSPRPLEPMVSVQFGDGHAVYAPIEEITQLVVREDAAKDTPGFSVGNARTAVD